MARIINSQNRIDADLNEIPDYVTERLTMINYVRDLGKQGKPKTPEELQTRLEDYFKICKDNAMKPTIEGMALACDIDRRTFWTWCNGKRGAEIQDICTRAKQTLLTFIETALYENKINAVAGIFSLKNCGGWQDTTTIEHTTQRNGSETALTLPVFSEFKELPTNEEDTNTLPEFKNNKI